MALGTEEPVADRPAKRVNFDEVMERYLARRTDEDPEKRVKHVTRVKELGQRIAKAADFFGSRPVSDMNEALCEEFTAFVGSDSYARRILGDVQAALNEFRRAGFLREVVTVSMPPAPQPREDWLTMDELIALVRVCWTHRDEQMRMTREGLRRVKGRKRPWAHLVRFIAVATMTCSRSSRVYEASYVPEPGRPYVDLDAGLLYRKPPGARQSRKQAPPVRLNPRLVAAMRRWSSDRVVGGQVVPGDRYVVQWAGRAADPKGAFVEAVAEARKQHPKLFLRRDGLPKKIVRHTLRHTGITHLTLAGVPPLDICSFAGLTMATYLRVYSHHHAQAAENVVAAQSKKPRLKAPNTKADPSPRQPEETDP